jgi:hypothetical protein
MENKYRIFATMLISILTFITLLVIFFTATPLGKSIYNKYDYTMNKVDEQTYKKQKEVEDTCRSLIASYNSDKMIYEQYKDSSIQEEISWSNSAKIRANQTASTYNNYILKNSFVWQNNIPSDIFMELQYIQ